MKDTKVTYVKLSSVNADPDQPRKHFDAERLAELAASISKHGIINPLIVEKSGAGYILVDGERRFRASKIAKLTEIPVIVVENKGPVDRLIQQFHLQEQHQGWSATEKAVAVAKLAESLKIGVVEIAKTLAIPERTIADYVAFSKLLDRDSFQKNEMPIHYARAIVNLGTFVKKELMEQNDEEFTQEDGKRLERAIIARVKSGQITKPIALVRIHDSVKTDPSVIHKFLKDDKMSADKLFLNSKAKAAFEYRNIYNGCRYLSGHLPAGVASGAYKLIDKESGAYTAMVKVHKQLGEYIKMVS